MKLQDVGNVHNINLITPEHVVPQILLSILRAKELGLRLPIVYNTSAVDSLESLDLLDGLVDMSLPDCKIWTKASSKLLLNAEDHASAAMENIKAMHAQVGNLCFTPNGIAQEGTSFETPRHARQRKRRARDHAWLGDNVSRDIFVNIMEQYHPDAHDGKPLRSSRASSSPRSLEEASFNEPGGEPSSTTSARYSEINRTVTGQEISSVRRAAEDAGIWRFCDPVHHDGFTL